ncbi:MAG: hypothetical protein K1X94_24660, partial [Sandaracinaceae bacterium]|nr:hypothetical protein [Sandaracinaceae bacterium]
MAASGEPSSAEERVVLWARVSAPSGLDAPGRRSRPPPRGEAAYSLSGAIGALEARLVAGGGRVEAQLSGLLVASFSGGDALEAVELGLELLDEAQGYDLAIALSLSPTWKDGGVRVGSAFDDAFSLAARAKTGEILVDGALRDRVPGTFLFTRQVSQGGVRAGSIDRRHPRRAECLSHLTTLGSPPLVSATRALVTPVAEAMRAPRPLVVLEGPLGAGASELFEAARAELGIERSIWLGAASGALATLESLSRALGGEPARSEAQARVVAGEILPLEDLVALVSDLLGDGPAWIVLNPLAAIDTASLEVVASVRARRANVGVIARAPIDTPLAPFLGALTARFTLPALRLADAREVVRAIVGPDTSDDVVRRVAVMGGDTTLGCEEAARLLIASGDLVRDGAAFVWRTTPRGGVEGVGVEELARTRLDLLAPDARRVLEILAVLPRGASRDLLRAVATHDGLSARAVAEALTALTAEGWLTPRDEPTAHFARRVVQTSMPPARLAELHRFAVDAVRLDATHHRAAAHFALEGGRDDDAREEAQKSADRLASAGFSHAVARFAGGTSIPAPAPSEAAPDETTSGAIVAPSRAPGPPTAPYSALAPSSAGGELAAEATPLTDDESMG